MKKKLLYTIFILLPIFCLGQNNNRAQSDYLGEWNFSNDEHNITLVLEQLKHKRLNGEIEDFIVGFLKYEKNGQIIINTLDNKTASNETREYNMNLVGNFSNKDLLNFTFNDPILNKFGNLTLKLKKDELIWTLEEVKYGSKSFDSNKSVKQGFSIPEKISFNKNS